MNQYRDKGVVLRTYKLGEADRIIVIMTQGHGKVRAVAKGVRKTKSKIGQKIQKEREHAKSHRSLSDGLLFPIQRNSFF